MTHDELLVLLNAKSDSDEIHALRAVVELHQNHGECGMPTTQGTYPCPATNTCHECGTNVSYPCPTIQAIEKELG